MLFGLWTKYTCRPTGAGGAGNAGCGTSPRVQPPNDFSAIDITASGSTAPTTRSKALLGR